MGLKEFFSRKKRDNRVNYDFDDEDRQISLAKRQERSIYQREKAKYDLEELRINHQIEMMERRADLEQLKELLSDSGKQESGNIEEAALMMLLSKFANTQPHANTPAPVTPTQQNTISPPEDAGVHYSDEQLKNYWDSMPKFVKKLAKNMTDEQLGAEISSRMPSMDDDSINRAIGIIRNG